MKNRVVWMFSGQGSQYHQMGRELFEQEPVFREWFERGDSVVKKLINESLRDLVYSEAKKPGDPFKRTLHTHPAIFLVEYSLAQLLLSKGLKPDLLLGYSVGEFAAYAVAEVIPFEETLVALVKQAEIVEYCTPEISAIAVLHSQELLQNFPSEFSGCQVASVNFSKGFTIVGPSDSVRKIQAFLKSRSISAMEIPICHGFHSSWLDMAGTPLRALFSTLAFGRSNFELVSAVSGENPPLDSSHLWQAIRGTVNFPSIVSRLEARGPFTYLDVGPSGTMATMVKYNLAPGSASTPLAIMNPFGRVRDQLGKALSVAGG